MFTKPEEFKKHLATGLLLGLGLFLLYFLRAFFLAVFGAYVFSFMFSAVYIRIKRWVGRDEPAALLTVLMILVVAFVPLLLLCYTAFSQALALEDRFDPQTLDALLGRLTPGIRTKVELLLQRTTEGLASTLTAMFPTIVAGIAHVATSLFVMFFVMYYIFVNIHYIFIRSAEFLPFKQPNAIWVMREFEHISRAILIGQFLISSLQGLMGGIGFLIFGLHDAVLWGLVMAVLSLVPLVGTSLVWLPASLYLVAQGDYFSGVGLFLWGFVVVSHIDNFVRPKLGRKLGDINPIVMVLGAFAGLQFFGIVGVVVGPFLLAFFLLLLQVYRQEYLGHPAPLTRSQILTGLPTE